MDTGSSVSLIRPNTFDSEVIHVSPIILKTAAGKITLNIIQEVYYNNQENTLQFYIHEFSKIYDGLLGYDILNQLDAKINVKEKLIVLNGHIYTFLIVMKIKHAIIYMKYQIIVLQIIYKQLILGLVI